MNSEKDDQVTKYIDDMKEKRDGFARLRELGAAINLEHESLGVKQLRGLMVKSVASMVDYIDHMLQGMEMSRAGVAEVAATVTESVKTEPLAKIEPVKIVAPEAPAPSSSPATVESVTPKTETKVVETA